MKRLCCTAQIVALALLSGCGTVELFGKYDLPEGPDIESAPWPKLSDTPAAPPVGTYTDKVPDPATGIAIQIDLAAAGAAAAKEAEALAEPVIDPEERDAMIEAAKRKE